MHHKDLTIFLAKGEPEAFRLLFDEYFNPLCLYALRFTRDKSSAEEVVHETFVKLWEHREHIGITESLSGYFYKSVQNNALNYLKKEQIKNKYSEAYAERLKHAEEYFTVTQESGLSIVLAKELESRILEAVDSLPEQCREIFKLSRFAGLKNQEIAEKKQVTINTVQKQISIALEKLRKSLSYYLPKVIHLLVFIELSQ
jgi:RNA polymerase sigma-70 factor (ECF subfamily)